jgi:glycosyltransferase 2 family protein
MTPINRRRVLRIVFGAIALAFVAVALLSTWDETQDQKLPDPATLALAGVLVVSTLVGGSMSWLALFGKGAPRRLISDFYLAQLGKYIPGGGIWQAAGQVGLSASPELTATRVTSNLAVHGVIQLSAALTIGGFLAFNTDLSGWLRILCGLGLAAPLILHRSWMAFLLGRVGARMRLDATQASPPDQRTIVRSWLWILIPIAGFSVAFGLMIHTLEPGVSIWRSAPAFAMAWGIGFALIPFPAGLGVREAALIALVGGSTAITVAVSIILRLLAIAGDLILVLLTRRIRV